MDENRLSIAKQNLARSGHAVQTVANVLDVRAAGQGGGVAAAPLLLPGAAEQKYDIAVAVLALRVIVAPPAHYRVSNNGGPEQTREEEVVEGYRRLFETVFASLSEGGTFLIGDHTGAFSLYGHMRLMEDVGFEDIDCAWRERDFFVCGGRKPEAFS